MFSLPSLLDAVLVCGSSGYFSGHRFFYRNVQQAGKEEAEDQQNELYIPKKIAKVYKINHFEANNYKQQSGPFYDYIQLLQTIDFWTFYHSFFLLLYKCGITLSSKSDLKS